MKLEHSYYSFSSVISPENCKKIIDLGLSRLESYKTTGTSTSGITHGGTERQSKINSMPLQDKTIQDVANEKNISASEAEKLVYVRDSEVAWLSDQWLYDLLLPYIHKANYDTGWKFDIDNAEHFQFTVYHLGGFYGWHVDGISDHSGKLKRFIPGITPFTKSGRSPLTHTSAPNHVGKIRKLSMTLNLNAPNNYEGGNLTFDFGSHALKRFHECEEIKPQGSLVVFPSFLYHQVTPITQGTRYSLVLWSLGPPFK